MILYLTVIVVGGFLVAAIAALWLSLPFLYSLGYTWLAIASVIVLDAFIATLARSLPKKCADPSRKIFVVSTKEKAFYEKLRIRKWKDKIPEIGHFTGFRKNKLAEPKELRYVERFLLENCYGEIGHFFSAVLGFLILLFYPIANAWLAWAIPVATVNGVLNVLPIFVLRYNYYKLRILQKNLLRKSMRA